MTEEIMSNYHYKVIYSDKGHEFTETVDAGNAGTAFAECLRLHPDCQLIKAIVEGKYGSGHGHMEHLPPKVQRPPVKSPRPARALQKKERGCEFSFYDQVQNQEGAREWNPRPIRSPRPHKKKRIKGLNPDAIY